MESGEIGRFPPVYEHSFQKAAERGETEQFRTSRKLNIECAREIDTALTKYFDDVPHDLNTAAMAMEAAAMEVVDKFGFDRTMIVLANTVRHYSWDGRFSQTIKDWAQTVPRLDSHGIDRDCLIAANAGLVDQFAEQVWYDHDLTRPLETAEIKAEAEHVLKRLQSISAPNSPDRAEFLVPISPEFRARAKPEDYVEMIHMLPFSKPLLTTLPRQKGFFVAIQSSEVRNKHQHLRKPSIKAKLAVKPVPSDKPIKKKHDRDVR